MDRMFSGRLKPDAFANVCGTQKRFLQEYAPRAGNTLVRARLAYEAMPAAGVAAAEGVQALCG